eukprot:TRINITY_DN207_c0_g1_i1.p1 TRINITY_DN207_c0_g1~~TRINITY_DN207_c0_g1_i1.p1  ORF type:complete len:352 (-),score=32.47 TRINITY_DN207_c0_g1_i1:267-1322(-)
MGCIPSSESSRTNNAINKELNAARKKFKEQIKILLLGPGESGKSTIFKQMKIIQKDGGYKDEELMEYKYIIFTNCISQMKCLLEAGERLNMGIADGANRPHVASLNACPSGGDTWSPELALAVKSLWGDKGIREIYSLRDKHYQLNDSAAYFFDNVDRFMQKDYKPSQDDVLRARIRTTGIQEAEFQFEDIKFRMLDVGGQRSERRKWIHCFDSVTAVMFCVAMSEYDQTLREDQSQNRMKESLLLFDEVCNSVWFKDAAFILFLNKMDLLKEKLARGSELTQCFPNYTGGSNFDSASAYIKQRFLDQNRSNNHPIYAHYTCAISTENVEFVFTAVKETVLQQIFDEVVPF